MVIACSTMLIDHIGFMFFPEMIELRLIGRISMPIYAYCIANGYIHTRNRKRYIKRISLIAFLSQIPFCLMVQQMKLNTCFTWIVSIAILWCIDGIDKKPVIKVLTILLLFVVSEYIPMDYGVTAVLWVVMFYIYPKLKLKYSNYFMVVSGILISLIHGVPLQLFSVISITVIWFCEKHNLSCIINKKQKNVYRMFYPLHLSILILIKICVSR